jgi:hypothetical protein
MFNVYKDQQIRQTGSRNLTGPKTLPTIWYTYMMLVTKYQISAINSYWEKCDEKYLGRTEVNQYNLPLVWSDCQHQMSNFSTISWREQVAYQQWGVLCTRLIQLVGFLMLAHCNKSTGRHITPIWHISLILSQPVFAFTLSVACLEEKQPIPILYGPTPTITQLIQFMTVW